MGKIIITEEQYNMIIEDYHVSFNSRVWSEKLLKLVKDSQYDKFRINGKKYPELYQQFPVDYFYVEKGTDLDGAAYEDSKSGYKNGEFCVYFVFGKNGLFPGAVDHELRHAYEDYKRQSNNGTKITQTKEVKKIMTDDMLDILMGKHGNLGIFSYIFWGFYYTSKLEQAAYSENVYNGNKTAVHNIKNLIDKNYIGALEDPITRRYWEKVKQFNIPILNSFKHYDQFIIWAEKKIKQDAYKIIKKYNKINYLKTQN